MLPDEPERRARWVGVGGLVLAALATAVFLAYFGDSRHEAGFWYGVSLVVAGTLFGYRLGFDRAGSA